MRARKNWSEDVDTWLFAPQDQDAQLVRLAAEDAFNGEPG